jgi:hypothetical protein
MLKRYPFLQVKNGNVNAINEAGNVGMSYYKGGDATRADWASMYGEGYVEILLENGTILILNRGGNQYRVIR